MIAHMSAVRGPALTMEHYAAITALIDAGIERDKVLNKAGIAREAWAVEQVAWLSAMAKQATLKRFALQNQFNTQLVAYLAALDKGDALDVADGVALGVSPVRKRVPLPIAVVDAAPVSITIDEAMPIAQTALPFTPVPSPVAPPAVPQQTRERYMTLPFKKPEPKPKSKKKPKLAIGATLPVDATAAGLATLPFASAKKSGKARKAKRPKPLDHSALLRNGSAAPDKPDEPLTGTMLIADMKPANARLTLEQFASLTAEIATQPADQAAIEKRYGLSDKAHDVERRAWAMKFLDDQTLAGEFRTKLAQFKAWLGPKHK